MPEYLTEGPWRVDMTTDNRTWASNALRFNTPREAEEYARDLAGRWLASRGYRVVPTDHPQREAVNYEADAAAGFLHRGFSS